MDESKKIRAILLTPFELAKTVEIDDSLESLQSIVGGDIEIVYPFEDDVCLIVCNEEGKLVGLKPNRALYDAAHEIIDILCGPVIVCGMEGSSLCSLSDALLEKYNEMYRYPQMFFKIDGAIQAVQVRSFQDVTKEGEEK